MDIQPLAGDFGLIVTPTTTSDLSQLEQAEVLRLFKESGVLIFRGFDHSAEIVRSFCERFMTSVVKSTAHDRPAHATSKSLQSVTSGAFAINLHYEFGRTPFRPDLIWFYCVTPSRQGGETLLCDGISLLTTLPQPVVQVFKEQRVLYSQEYTEAAWLEKVTAGGTSEQALSELQGITIRRDNGVVCVEYLTPAVSRPKHAPHEAFVATIFPGVFKDMPPPKFENRAEISSDLIGMIEAEAKALTVVETLKSGDLAMVDNTRVMHGRSAFVGEERSIFALCGNLR